MFSKLIWIIFVALNFALKSAESADRTLNKIPEPKQNLIFLS